jgi:hypothetical protein
MASLFENMPGMNTVRDAMGSSGNNMSNIILYILLIAIFVLVYLLLTGYKFSIKSIDIRPEKYKALDKAYVFWKTGTVLSENLRITDDQLPIDMDNKYTFHFDLLLTNTRNTVRIDGPYRHIFHRGSSDLFNEQSDNAVASMDSTQLPPYGLPRRLNPGIFLDPNTNDIIIFVDTKSTKGEVYRESGRISDIPVDKPLRLTVSVHNKVLEVDLNCKLELTKVLAGDPRQVENVLYGLCGPANAEANIQNLIVWPYAISNDTLVNFCPMPFPSFQPPAKSCNSPMDPALTSSAATARNAVNSVTDWLQNKE